MPHVVDVGAGYAGVLAALRAARIGRGRVDVTLIGASDRFVERVRLHQWAAGGRAVERPIAEMLAGTAVKFVRARVSRVGRGGVDTSAGAIGFDRAIVCDLCAWAAAELMGGRPQVFRFGDPGLCVSLGRRDGIIQFVEQDGRPREALLTGRLAAWLKEQVCRYTVWTLHAERRGLWAYRWPRPRLASVVAAEVAA